eukprot:GHUV01003159.1.p1 GENE.GHUV01003159.1~~GHUV01003159.1.p1  ORF type:complete len:370 (+),score=119.68 GHUV01003159.1:213-1322(+)
MSMLAMKSSARQGIPTAVVAPSSRVIPSRFSICRAVSRDDRQNSDAAPESATQPQPVASTSTSTALSSFPYNIMTALAAAGALETTYLTANKLLNTAVACPTSGCDSVLNSPYAELFGLPLPLYGAATYAAVAVAAYMAQQSAVSGRAVPYWLSAGLAAGVGVLAATSGYLMYILHTQLGGASCVWCYASAGISFALLSSLIAGMDKRQMADAAGPGLGATAAAVLTLYLGFGPGQGISNAAELELPYISPTVTTESSEQTISLAKRLREAGAKMYGAFWCSHCYDQKQEFGQQAMADFPYVECFPEGWKKGVKIADACEAASVKAFPTWIINGNTTEGQLELEQLEQQLQDAAQPAAATADAEAAVAQ